MVRRFFAGIAVIALTTVVVAQTDPIATRRNLMKANGASARLGGQMAKGEVPFDLAKAHEIFQSFERASATMPTLYPDTSKTGGETTASPKIWEDMADFRARFETWAKEAKTAETETTDLATFRAAFGNVTKACGSCHNVYRIKT